MKRWEMLANEYRGGLRQMAMTGSCTAMECDVCPFKAEWGYCSSESSKDRRIERLNQEVEV